MKRIVITLGAMLLAITAQAADRLNGTTWKTIDDETKQPKALVKFIEQKDGSLSATIQTILNPKEANSCSSCEGPYKNKSLQGVTIVKNLKNVGGNNYDGGTILDPKNGKSYKLKGELSGNQLKLRGFIGISALGRDQVWVRAE